jgi:hypothetical protein
VTTIAAPGAKQKVNIAKIGSTSTKKSTPKKSAKTKITINNLKKNQRVVVRLVPVRP